MIIANHFVLAVHDEVAAGKFFVEALDFVVTREDGDWTFVKRDNCMIMLGRCSDAIPARQLGDHSYFGYLVVDDVDEVHSGVTASGLGQPSQPTDKPWNMREFTITTPEGHRMTIGQPLTGR